MPTSSNPTTDKGMVIQQTKVDQTMARRSSGYLKKLLLLGKSQEVLILCVLKVL